MTPPKSRLIYVTGAGRGIGRAIALKLAQEGFAVSGCARSMNELEETKKSSGGKIRVTAVDVTDFEAVKTWMDQEEKEAARNSSAAPFGLVTAAGIYGPIGPFLENDWSEWKKGIEINLYGSALAAKYFAQKLIARQLRGRIVLLSGGGATQPLPRFSNYGASKAAVVRFGETLALELAPYGICVTSIAPGAVNTKLTDDLIKAGPSKAGQAMYEKALKQREGGGTPPDKAADLTAYLMSDAAGEVTGKLLSAVWDPWTTLHEKMAELSKSDVYTLRRIVPDDRKRSGPDDGKRSGPDDGKRSGPDDRKGSK